MSQTAPAIPFFGDAYLADTRHLSLEEHGAYLQLMMIAWRIDGCCLPDDDGRLARMLGCTAAKWRKLKPTVMAFWVLTPCGWRHSGRCTQPAVRASIPRSVRDRVFERDNGTCVYCGRSDGPLHLDHVFPWSRGGDDEEHNLVVACEPCNRAKADRTPEEWRG